jgi:hypothetical protein
MPESKFTAEQAVEVSKACAANQVEYLFIGKSGAILLGYPATTQDVDLFLPKDRENAARMIRAVRSLGFVLSRAIQKKILDGADFIQLKHGPFDLDLVHAPDGISSFADARKRAIIQDGFPVANLRDIIARKRASNREKDLADLLLLEEFRREYEKRHAPAVETALQKALRKTRSPQKPYRKSGRGS